MRTIENEKELFMRTIENEKYVGVWDKETELYRITRKSDGLIGGYIEKLSNLSEYGNCFVFDNAKVFNNAKVSGNCLVFDNAKVFNNSIASDNVKVFDNSRISDNARVFNNSIVSGNAQISNGEITKTQDYITLKNRNSSGRYYTYNYTSDTWVIGCLIATTTELVSHLELEENASAIQKDEYTKAIKFVLSL